MAARAPALQAPRPPSSSSTMAARAPVLEAPRLQVLSLVMAARDPTLCAPHPQVASRTISAGSGSASASSSLIVCDGSANSGSGRASPRPPPSSRTDDDGSTDQLSGPNAPRQTCARTSRAARASVLEVLRLCARRSCPPQPPRDCHQRRTVSRREAQARPRCARLDDRHRVRAPIYLRGLRQGIRPPRQPAQPRAAGTSFGGVMRAVADR